MKNILLLSVILFLAGCRTNGQVNKNMYEGMQKSNEFKKEQAFPNPEDVSPSYERYQKERVETSKEKKKKKPVYTF